VRRALRLLVCVAVICAVSLVAAVPANAKTLFSDGFESGDFESWTLMKTTGAGVTALQSQDVRTGAVAAELSNNGSVAYMRKKFAPPQRDLTASGSFRVVEQGGRSVPFLTLLATDAKRAVSVYRDGTSGEIRVADGVTSFPTSGALPLDTWGEITVHAIVAGKGSTVEVLLNGTRIFQTTSADLGGAGIMYVQLGSELSSQAGTVVADDIIVSSGAPSTLARSVHASVPWPAIEPSPAVRHTVTAASKRPPPARVAATTVGLWHMDETSGTTMHDSSGAGHDGTLKGSPLPTMRLPGFSGTAFGFAPTGYVKVPADSTFNPGSANVTLTMRVKATKTPASPDWDLIRKGLYTTSGGEYKMEYQPSGQVSCGFKGSSGYYELMAGPAVNNGQWHTVQCVKTSSTVKVVVDGAAFSKSATLGSIAPSNTDGVPIGARPGSEYFNGSLDEASIQFG
jgi:concanavalin A-like lectin/glucanase superfamily protein